MHVRWSASAWTYACHRLEFGARVLLHSHFNCDMLQWEFHIYMHPCMHTHVNLYACSMHILWNILKGKFVSATECQHLVVHLIKQMCVLCIINIILVQMQRCSFWKLAEIFNRYVCACVCIGACMHAYLNIAPSCALYAPSICWRFSIHNASSYTNAMHSWKLS